MKISHFSWVYNTRYETREKKSKEKTGKQEILAFRETGCKIEQLCHFSSSLSVAKPRLGELDMYA